MYRPVCSLVCRPEYSLVYKLNFGFLAYALSTVQILLIKL